MCSFIIKVQVCRLAKLGEKKEFENVQIQVSPLFQVCLGGEGEERAQWLTDQRKTWLVKGGIIEKNITECIFYIKKQAQAVNKDFLFNL